MNVDERASSLTQQWFRATRGVSGDKQLIKDLIQSEIRAQRALSADPVGDESVAEAAAAEYWSAYCAQQNTTLGPVQPIDPSPYFRSALQLWWDFEQRRRAVSAPKIPPSSIEIPDQHDADLLGRKVRETWVAWAKRQPNPKPSWLLSYDELNEEDKQVDREIGVAIYLFAIGENHG